MNTTINNDKMQIQNGEISKKFAAVIKERLATLLYDNDNDTAMPDYLYNIFKNIVHTTTEQEIGYKQFNEDISRIIKRSKRAMC